MTARTPWPVDHREARAGYCNRVAAELHADLIAGCRTLGQLSDGWNAVGYVPTADLPDVDRLLTGLHSTLIALRAQEATMLPNPQMKNPAGGPGFSRAQTLGNGLQRHSTISPIDVLLARLEGVQRSGKGYRAQCPACGGTSRKLSLCEGDNGAVLMTCFSCHDAPGVLGALGLSLADLYPQRIKDTTPEGRRAARQAFKQSAWGAAVGVLATEATVIEVAAELIARGEALNDDGMERVHLASQRIHAAQEVLR